MPTVERAETPAVSRPAQPLRDKPGQSADVFAAVFDSMRRSVGSRVDRAIRQHQRTVRSEAAGTPAAEQSSADVSIKRKELNEVGKAGKPEPQATTRASTQRARSTESDRPSRSAASREPHPRAGAEEQNHPETRVQPAETGKPSQAAPPDDSQQPAGPDGESDPQLQTTSGETVPLAGPIGELSDLPPQHPFRDGSPARQSDSVAGEAASTGAGRAVTKALSASCEGVTVDAEVGGAPSADTPAESGDPAAAGQAGQTQPAETDSSQPDMPPLRVWTAFKELILNAERGIGARLAEAVAAVAGKPGADASPSGTDATQATSGEATAGRPTGGQATSAMIAAVLDSQGVPWDQKEGASSKDHNKGNDAGRDPSAGVNRADNGTQQISVTDGLKGLLEAAGRVRDRIASLDPQPAAGLIGRNLAGKGVNLGEARAINELADVVRANIGGRNYSILLRLDPPELGQLRIDVRMQGQELTLRLQADTLAGHDALRSRLQDLRSALEQHGFKLNQAEVELRVPQAPTAEPHQDRSAQQQGHWDGQTWREPGWQGQAHGEPDTSAGSGSSNENPAFSTENASIGEEHDKTGRPAETGVDLVV